MGLMAQVLAAAEFLMHVGRLKWYRHGRASLSRALSVDLALADVLRRTSSKLENWISKHPAPPSQHARSTMTTTYGINCTTVITSLQLDQ